MKNPSNSTIDRNRELKAIYKKWPEIKRFLKSKGCKTTDAEDIFQEALLIYSRKKDDPDFKLDVEPFYYVKNTCKFLWYNQSRKENKYRQTELHENFREEEDEWLLKELKLRKIEGAIAQIGKQCQQILQLFYGLGLNMVEIAQKVGLRNDKVARVQKYRCINKVKEIVQNEQVTSDSEESILIKN